RSAVFRGSDRQTRRCWPMPGRPMGLFSAVLLRESGRFIDFVYEGARRPCPSRPTSCGDGPMRRPSISAPDERNAGRLDEGEPSPEVFGRAARLGAEFLERRRRGERPTIEEYVAGHPDLAAAIRELFPALVMVEGLKPGSDETFGIAGEPGAP